MTSTPAEPDPQPRDIAVEQPTPDQLADLEQRSDGEGDGHRDGAPDGEGVGPAPEQG